MKRFRLPRKIKKDKLKKSIALLRRFFKETPKEVIIGMLEKVDNK
jgi:hypothetical protein